MLSSRESTRGPPFAPQVGAQVGAKLRSKSTSKLVQNFDPVSGGILERLGLDFGGVLGAEMKSERKLKIRSTKT